MTTMPKSVRDDRAARLRAGLGSALFLLVAPGTVAGLVPWWISRWQVQAAAWDVPFMRVVGAVLAVAGALVLLDSFVRFALQGVGTPAPVSPPRHLVISGFYRYVRNPMYVAVVSVIVGQGLLFGNLPLLVYGAFVWLVCHVFVSVYEEPTLLATFGSEYEAFCAHVPRWVPRLRPWRGAPTQSPPR